MRKCKTNFIVNCLTLLFSILLTNCKVDEIQEPILNPDAGEDVRAKPDVKTDATLPLCETLPDYGENCGAGVGVCKREGIYRCSEDGNSLICSAVPKEPTEEICDGEDNNCDGMIDNGDADQDGYDVCADCNDNSPSQYPGAEEISGDDIDQDCDGEDKGNCSPEIYEKSWDLVVTAIGGEGSCGQSDCLGFEHNFVLIGYQLPKNARCEGSLILWDDYFQDPDESCPFPSKTNLHLYLRGGFREDNFCGKITGGEGTQCGCGYCTNLFGPFRVNGQMWCHDF